MMYNETELEIIAAAVRQFIHNNSQNYYNYERRLEYRQASDLLSKIEKQISNNEGM